MAKQDKKREKKKDVDKKEEAAGANPEVVEKGKKLKEDLDTLMDEIDDVLEENAEEFVKNYVQKGGE
ncbi:MAG TPA: ubiquitin-like protein Pup [Candidatus Manganitrophaceae bacterium]